MTSEVTMQPMSTADIDAVLALEGGSFSGVRWTHQMFVEELMRDDRAWWVAVEFPERGDADWGDVVGCAGIWVVDGDAHVLGISVDPKSRRRGIARLLMEAASASAFSMGARRMTLEVSVTNAAALALYESLGFTSVGLRTGYYEDGIDANVMFADLAEEER